MHSTNKRRMWQGNYVYRYGQEELTISGREFVQDRGLGHPSMLPHHIMIGCYA